MFPLMEAKDQAKPASREKAPEPSREEIEAQLVHIVGSADFDVTARTQRFLQFIVQQVLEGKSDEISQYAIATNAFGRGDQFDPTEDPIVRIQAGRLRRSLEHYYLTSGATDPVRISVPKGAYVPAFRYQQAGDTPDAEELTTAATFDEVSEEAGSWPTLLVMPFQNLTGDPKNDYLGQGLATELGIELDHYQIVRVFIQPQTASPYPNRPETATRFRLEGSIEARAESLRVLVRLLDTSSGAQIWGKAFRCDLDDPELSTFLDEVAGSAAAAIADERGIIVRHLVRERRVKRPVHGLSHDAVLRFYHFNANPSPEGFHEVLAALKIALDTEPDQGLLWSLRARMLAMNHSLEITPTDSSIDDAYAYARIGVRLEPDNQRTRSVLSYVYLLRDELDAGRREAEAALNLNPNSFAFVDVIGYLLTLLGDWERGIGLTEKAMRLNPFHQPPIHYARWLNHLRLGENEQAYEQAVALGYQGGFWAPLARATALSHLGRLNEARVDAAQLLELRPDFASRGHWLITRYVKFDELVEHIATGLRKAGLALNES